jgi:Phosphodiester glycosidase/WD40-like Beta Propeller Repeat
MRASIPAAVAVVLVTALSVGVDPARGDVGTVAFVALRGGGFDVMTVGIGAGAPEGVRAGPTDELDPAWAPGGGRLAFVSLSESASASNIWTSDPHGERLRRLTMDHTSVMNRHPAWSPRASRIAWTRSVPRAGTAAIWVMDARDGRPARPLTDPPEGTVDAAPAWSPVGDRIAYVSDRRALFPDLHLLRVDGRGRRRLTDTGAIEANPAWSPDGTTIAFERARPGEPSNLWTIVPATGEERRITSAPGWESDPAWSPDGRHVAFVSAPRRGGDRELRLLNVKTGAVVAVAAGPGGQLAPAWRPISGRGAAPPLPAAAPPTARSGTAEDPGGAALGRRYVSRSRRLTDGVWFRRLVDRRAPNRIFVIRVAAEGPTAVDVGLGSGVLPGYERPTSIAWRYRAIAATNGDFPIPGNGRPVHAYAEDGELGQTSFARSETFSFSSGRPGGTFRRPGERIVLREASGEAWRLTRWNAGEPAAAEVAGVSPLGAGAERPPKGSCSARLVPTSGWRWTEGRRSVARVHVVDAVGCRADRLTRGDGSVISARPGSVEALLVASLTEGETVTVEWTLGSPGTNDAMGGNPLLLRGGRVVVTRCRASLCRRHPRTGVGLTEDGSVLLVVVDGRRPLSRGLTLVGFARLLRSLGARWALNLDGGGSSVMVVNGRIVNVPSDGRERPACCAMLVLPGPDPGLVEGVPPAEAPPAPAGSVRSLIARDPGSTGGLADALARGVLDGGLPLGLHPALRAFRAGRSR